MIVKVKSSSDYQLYDQCHLGISIGNANSRGQALEGIIQWINQQDFKHCFIDLSDTLHRHNFMYQFSLSEDHAFDKAREEGDEWLRNNLHQLENLNISWDLYRWEHWLNNETVHSYHEIFKNKFIQDDMFRSLIFNDVRSFTSRNGLSLSKEYLKFGSAYLLEELAVLSYYFKDYHCAKIYPGKEQTSFKSVRLGHIDNVPKGLQNTFYTQLWLHNNKKKPKASLKPYSVRKPINGNGNVNDNIKQHSSLTG